MSLPLVVNLGLPKTGTTTLSRALRRAGLRVADHRIHASQTRNEALQGAFVAHLLYLGYFQRGDPLVFMKDFQGFAEISVLRSDGSVWPQTDAALIRALTDRHPEVRYVATRRATAEVVDSMNRWHGMGTKRMPNLDIPGLPKGFGHEDRHKERWVDGHYANLAAMFAGDARYLELDVAAADAAARLGAHLGLEIPWWGVANENPPAADREGAE